MNKILNQMDYMDHHYEHHFVTNSDNIDHVKAKLDKRDENSQHRITELEDLVKKEVSGTLADRLNTLESTLKAKMDHKILKFESKIDKQTSTPEYKKKMKNSTTSNSWILPFLFLFFMLLFALGGFYYFYQKLLRKMHLP